MRILKVTKKPIVIDAVELLPDVDDIVNALKFTGKPYTPEDVEKVQRQRHINLGSQNAEYGDFILKGYTADLGTYFYPVNPEEFIKNYKVFSIHL